TVAGWKSSYEPSGQSVRVQYPDAGRTLNRYASDFLARARNLSRQNWDTRYLAASAAAYIKAGFRGGSAGAPPSVPVISVPGQHGTLTFQPGQTDRTVTIQVKGDPKREANETFALNLLGATNARIADGQGIATVVNDD